MDKLWGIRVDEHVEIEGLDLAEHGTWGYPEFGIADHARMPSPSATPQPRAATRAGSGAGVSRLSERGAGGANPRRLSIRVVLTAFVLRRATLANIVRHYRMRRSETKPTGAG